ncbi:MAG: transposase InsO family protein [Oleispira sp.]|jgi:transposase InsO family protein
MSVINQLAKNTYNSFSGWLFNLTLFFQLFWLTYLSKDKTTGYTKSKTKDVIQENSHPNQKYYKNRKKNEWVINEVLRIKAFHNQAGCRHIADIFNYRYENHRVTPETVSKTFVATTIRNHLYEIQILRRNIKSKPAHNIPFNKVWGIDLTFVNEQPILGVIEHHSRKCLSLKNLKNKSSITILRGLLNVLEHHPKPTFIRSDNEICFNSKLIKFGLWFLGIKKQTIDKHSPWQNGRIERFFGTLKSTIQNLPKSSTNETELPYLLHSFEWWYNEIRLHQNLDGQTPASVHEGKMNKYQQRE